MITELTGFLGIPFGSSMPFAQSIFESRGGKEDLSLRSDTSMVYEQVKFAGRTETQFIVLRFIDNEFCQAKVFLKTDLSPHVLPLYKQIKSEINDRYYFSTRDYENYTNSAFTGPEYTVLGIQAGHTQFSCFWPFKSESEKDNYISITIETDLHIVINYENGDRLSRLVERINTKDSLDY